MVKLNDDYDEIEVQLGNSSEFRCFKNVTGFIEKDGVLEFNFEDIDLKSWNGVDYRSFTSRAEIIGTVVSKIKRNVTK